MPAVKGVIFDFDGTLIRSHREVHRVIVELTAGRCPPPTPEELRTLDTRETLKRLNVPKWQVPWFVFRARRSLAGRLGAVEFEPGVLDVIRDLKRRQISVALVTSNSRDNVMKLLARDTVVGLFDLILTGSSLLSKHRTLTRAVRQLGLTAEEVISIGDETRDLDAAKRLGLRSIAVGWGFHTIKRLREHDPFALVETPVALQSTLLALSN